MGIGDSKPEQCITGLAQHVLTSTLTYTTHLHTRSDAEREEVRTLPDPANKSSTTTSGDTPQAYAPVDTTHTTLANSGLGARAENETAVAMEGEIMSQGEDGEQSRIAGGGTGQHTTGVSEEMTQASPNISLTDEDAPIPPVSPHDTLADNTTNRGLDARAEDDAAVAMEGDIMSQGEDGGQSRMVGGGAGQHTTGANKTSRAMSSGSSVPSTCTSRETPRGGSSRAGFKEVPRYRAGRSRTKVKDHTSTSGTPATAATQPTTESAGCKRPTPDWP